MSSVQVFRSRFGIWITVLVMAMALLIALTIYIDQGISQLASASGPLGLMLWAVSVLFLLPRVEVDEGGVRVRNPFREHYISWGAIARIDTKYALTLITARRSISAWGAPAPGRHGAILATREEGTNLPESTYLAGTVRPGDLITSDSGAAAAHIRRIWESKRDQNLIASVNTRTYLLRLLVLGLLVLLSVLSHF